jgi:hypothetical protein
MLFPVFCEHFLLPAGSLAFDEKPVENDCKMAGSQAWALLAPTLAKAQHAIQLDSLGQAVEVGRNFFSLVLCCRPRPTFF